MASQEGEPPSPKHDLRSGTLPIRTLFIAHLLLSLASPLLVFCNLVKSSLAASISGTPTWVFAVRSLRMGWYTAAILLSLFLALSDHLKDWMVTSRRFSNISLLTLYSSDRTSFTLL